MNIVNKKFKNVKRKIRSAYCNLKLQIQQNPLHDIQGAVVTLFYDFEGRYSKNSRQQPCLHGVESILDIEKRYKINTTYNAVGRLLEDNPEYFSVINHAGHEIAAHSFGHAIISQLTKNEILNDVIQMRRLFESHDIELSGYRSPQSAWNFTLMKALLDSGYTWSAENGPEIHPYVIQESRGGKLWRFPIKGTDWLYEADNASPSFMVDQWKLVVNQAKVNGHYAAIGFHPWVQAKEKGRLIAFEAFIDWLTSQTDVHVMPFRDVLCLCQHSCNKFDNNN